MARSRASADRPFTHCEGSSPPWDPETYIADAELHAHVEAHLARGDLKSAIAAFFSLPPNDSYVYHASVSVTLAQAQHVLGLGAANGLHAWYRDAPPGEKTGPANEEDADAAGRGSLSPPLPPSHPQQQQQQQPPLPPALPPPPQPDIEAYLALFSPAASPAAALRSLASNAKKHSLRATTSSYLLSKRHLSPPLAARLGRLRAPRSHPPPAAANPYLLFLRFACRALEWCGPSPPASERAAATSHHALPVLMHHFGCACPTWEALEVLRVVARGREVLDLGSGGGYWSFALRRHLSLHDSTGGKPAAVTPVDSAQSAWRVRWVRDTVIAEGAAYLARRGGCPDAVLLLVYPVVGSDGTGSFTRSAMRAFKGDTLAVVGTQNRGGYTGFRGLSMDEYVARDCPGWAKVAQVALPSFPGKDEALFVFEKVSPPPEDRGGSEVGR